ncbi:50S ribosomal protein L5 [Candidatus Woesearchaeota archaeon]|nr:50S ribosomal protein L5 [Candidatus Woesearchaeota archaeon]
MTTNEHPMRKIRIEKITLNIGAGKEQARLEKAVKLLKAITGIEPVKTTTMKRIQAWGLRPGLPIGCKLTVRGKKAESLFKRLLQARDNLLSEKQFDMNGNLTFGIPEYIDIPDAKYDPDIGIMGLMVCVTLARPGYRICKRRIATKKIPHKHKVTKGDAITFMKKLGVQIQEAATGE